MDGTGRVVAISGEPGIGKSRLSHELLVLARARGAGVLVGRCSQDDGAPPLWPWAAVLRGLGEDLPLGPGGQDEGAGFRTWEAIVTALVAAYGWAGLGERIAVRCFTHDPSLGSSLKFLRRTPWSRDQVESLYRFMLREQRRARPVADNPG